MRACAAQNTLRQIVLFDMPESLAAIDSGAASAALHDEPELGMVGSGSTGFLLTGPAFHASADAGTGVTDVGAGARDVGDVATLRLRHRIAALQRAVSDLEFSRGAASRRYDASQAELRAAVDRQIVRHQRVVDADSSLRGLETHRAAVSPVPGTTSLAERVVSLLRARVGRDVRTYQVLLENQGNEAKVSAGSCRAHP